MSTKRHMCIGDAWVDARSGATFERRSPASGEVVGVYPEGGEADVELAIAAARRAFDDGRWSNAPAKQKAAVLRKAADLLRARGDALATLIATEAGKPLRLSKGEVAFTADVFDYYAGLALDLRGEAISQQVPDALGLVLREPVGVVGVITPWNFPLILVAWKLAPLLAAGCTAVAKPSHHTPGPTLELARILTEAGLPPGVFNVVTGAAENGAVVGQALVKSPLVDKIAFTGSTATGKKIAEAASATLKRVSLELGGKSPNIVFADAPSLEAAVMGAMHGIFMNSGQVCQAGSRLLVDEKIHDELLGRLVETTRKRMRLGDPLDPQTTMGPLISEGQLERVVRYLEAGKSSATLTMGGGRPSDASFARGHYVEPTIFDAVPATASIAQEEIFGPVLSVMTFRGIDDAITLANQTIYGLAAAVWTRDLSAALKMVKAIRAGTIWVNGYHGVGLDHMPYGGFKQSGLGRELGHEGIAEFFETKSVQIRI